MSALMCRCGCNQEAVFLATGREYAPGKYNGEPFTDEPCCQEAHDYLSESCDQFGFPFTSRPVADDGEEGEQ